MTAVALLAAMAAMDAPAPAEARADAGAPAAAPADSFRDLSRFGLERPTCREGHGCQATELIVLVGAGDANYGGFGLGYDLQLAFLDAEGTFARGKGELDAWGHFNGLGTSSPTASRPPAGEIGFAGEVGWGYVSPRAIGGGGGPLLLLDALSGIGGVFDGATLAAYTPNVEVGFLAHSAVFASGLEASLHLGGAAFYGDGPLAHLTASGDVTRTAFDPYFAAELRLDLPLSPTTMLRLGAKLALTPDWVMPGVERNLWWGRFEALVRFGPFITGPTLTFFAPQRQVGPGDGVTGAAPETSVLWLLGF